MTEILHVIGQGLRYPCYIILLLLIAVAIIEIGFVIYEAAQRAGSDKANTVELLHDMRGCAPDAIRAMLEEEPFLNRQKLAFSKLLGTADLPEEARIAAAKRMLEAEEDYYRRIVRITDTVAKLGPMFGLLGTLIPLGPGIVALGQRDTATLSQSMSVAFDTTIAGLIAAAVCSVISAIRKRWYAADLSDVETVMEGCLQEMKEAER